MMILNVLAFTIGVSVSGAVASDFLPSTPESDFISALETGENLAFCAEWNPEFVYRGHQCCAMNPTKKQRRKSWCSPDRIKSNYCNEMTDEQREYSKSADGSLDILSLISNEVGRRGQQAYCSVNNGFLANGRRLIPSIENRITLRTPDRCVDFGTDHMVGMLEWVGRQVAREYQDPKYSGVRMLVGDISAPRGGCLTGRGGRRGHSSHTSGLDVDIGFLVSRESVKSPTGFAKEFDGKTNWWLVKQIFQNPFVCIKVIFLDRKLISRLAVAASKDPYWFEVRRFIKHVKNHKNHFHIRIGERIGPAGCESDPDIETELESGDDDQPEEWLELINNAKAYGAENANLATYEGSSR